MGWLLAGYCGLALIHISVALNNALYNALDNTQRITQKPRFYGVQPGRPVGIYCLYSKTNPLANATWYKAEKYNATLKQEIKAGEGIEILTNLKKGAFLYISKSSKADNGVYFCRINKKWGPGTEVEVLRSINRAKAMYRTQMKDALIIFQGLLLAVCIAAVLLRRRQMQSEDGDSIYEEPETDHIYEGLAIETCGGGLYEELSVYAQADGTEAPWE